MGSRNVLTMRARKVLTNGIAQAFNADVVGSD